MKRTVFLVLSLLALLGIAGCSQQPPELPEESSTGIEETQEPDESEASKETEAATENTKKGDTEMTETDAQKPIEAADEINDVMNALQRGINVKTAFEPKYETFDCSWMRDDKVLQIIKDGGFDHIRIPVWINSHIDSKANGYKIDEDFLNTLEDYVKRANDLGLIVVIDYHDADALFTSKPSKEATEIFHKLWEQLASRFAKYPDTVIYELINEPKPAAMTDKLLAEVQLEAYRIIREENVSRPVVFAPNDHNGAYKLTTMELPSDDPNIIVSVHSYAPLTFTHQQLDEMGANFKNAVPYSKEVENAVMDALNKCKSYKDNNGVKIWLSEFGMSTFIEDTASVEKYLNKTTSTCKEYDISYCYWAFNAGIVQDFSPFNALTESWKDFVVDNLK